MTLGMRLLIIALLIMALFVHPAIADNLKFEASLDRNKVAIGDTAQLGLSFYGTQSMPAPDIGNIDGLEIRYMGPSTMMTVINGQVSSSVTHRYTVTPLKIGKFQLGPFSFKYKGNSYTSNMVFLEATEEKVIQQAKAAVEAGLTEKMNLEDRIFVKMEIGKASSYVNELIPVTVKLYVNRLNVSDIQLPTFAQEGFSKVEFKEPKQYREELDGLVYDVLEFNTKIFGTKPGDYRVGPAKIKCNLMLRKTVPTASGMMEDMFGDEHSRDSFFDDIFTRYERHPIELSSQDAQLIISSLPTQGRPRDFSGAVGDYQFIYAASPTKVKTGDPLTLRMDINGNGNFNTVLMPQISDTAGFKVYEPQVKTSENNKSFTQVLIPETDQALQVPKATFSYFDPNQREYKTITQGPIPIQVEKSKEEAPSQVIGPAPSGQLPFIEEELAKDIIYIKESPGVWVNNNYGIYKNKVFLVFVPVPLIFLIAFSIVAGKRNRFKRDTVYAGRMTAFRIAKRATKDLRRKLKAGDPKAFYEALFKTLQDYLGNRLHIPPAGITSDIIEYMLSTRDVDLDILRKVNNLFVTCDQVRFSFINISEHKMKDDLMELEDIMKYFEKRRV